MSRIVRKSIKKYLLQVFIRTVVYNNLPNDFCSIFKNNIIEKLTSQIGLTDFNNLTLILILNTF